ncbi:hypothetical protein FRC02_006477 [Tulasnella sp. 418]|nr:hypothetical protein FRC02_006477 [Tulasnella sp. 418]
MPLPSIGPVVVHGPQSQQLPQPSGSKHAVFFKLTQEAARALKDASIAARSAGQSPLHVDLSASTPGITIADQFFPITLKGDNDKAFELYHRTRHPNPTRPVHHRPAFFYDAQIVAEAHVHPIHDQQQPVVRKKTKPSAKPAKQTILLDDPPIPTPPPPNKNRKTASGSASAMARHVLQKPLTGAGGANLSSSSPRSTTPNTPLPSPPAKQTTFSESSSSLRSRVIHILALKPHTTRDLSSLLQLTDESELSEILRSVAYLSSPSSSKSSHTHWAPSYGGGSKSDGTWHLKAESYKYVHPYTWSGYDTAERQRIVEDVIAAFDELGLPGSASERLKLKAEEAAWRHASKALDPVASTSASKSNGLKQPRKLKVKKLGDPATGGTLSVPGFRGGTKISEKEKAPAKPTKTKTGTKKNSGYDSSNDRETSLETALMAQPVKKKTSSSTAASRISSAAPTPPISSSSTTKPALVPPSHSKRPSVTPPPLPSASLNGKSKTSVTASPQALKPKVPPSPVNNGSKASSIGMKRKRSNDNESSGGSLDADGEEVDEFGALASVDKWKPNGIERNVAYQETKKRKTDISDRERPPAAKLKSSKYDSHPETLKKPRPSSSSSNPTSLKPPPLINGVVDRTPTPTLDKATSKHKQQASLSARTEVKKQPSPAPPPVKKESPAPQSIKKKSGASWRSRREALEYTDSSEEEEEETPLAKSKSATSSARPSEKPLPEPTAPTKPVKVSRPLAVSAVLPASQDVSRPSSSRPQPRPVTKPKLPKPSSPRPLPKDPQALRDLWSERYAEYSELFAAISRERSRNEKALRLGSVDPAEMMDVEELEALVKSYGELHSELMQIKEAVAKACA